MDFSIQNNISWSIYVQKISCESLLSDKTSLIISRRVECFNMSITMHIVHFFKIRFRITRKSGEIKY